ncbi:MAG: metallophosphoesterase [Phycisphaerales bacterium JB063]
MSRRTVVISDTHLAGDGRGARSSEALRPLWQGADELIINGDFAELSDARWRGSAARQILKIGDLCEQDGVRLTFLSGNHDPLITDRRYLRLHGGEIFLTHGDMLHPSISPWVRDASKLRALHNDALSSLDPQQRGALDEQASVVQHVSGQKWDYLAQHHGPPTGKIKRMCQYAGTCARVLWFWHRLPRLAADFADRYAPEARYFVFGHFHRAGVWHIGGRTIINTGSFHAPRRPHAVVIEDGQMALHRVMFSEEGHTLVAKPRAVFPLSRPAADSLPAPLARPDRQRSRKGSAA